MGIAKDLAVVGEVEKIKQSGDHQEEETRKRALVLA
jgi:hypothetical protein